MPMADSEGGAEPAPVTLDALTVLLISDNCKTRTSEYST